MAKSLVKKGLQLVKSGFTEEEAQSRDKAELPGASGGNPKVEKRIPSKRNNYEDERRPSLKTQKNINTRKFKLKKACIKKIVDYVHECKAPAHKRNLRVRKITDKRRKSKADKMAGKKARFSVMNIQD